MVRSDRDRNPRANASTSGLRNDDREPTLREIAEEGNPMIRMMARIVEQQNILITELTHRGGTPRTEEQERPTNEGPIFVLERFKKLGPPSFQGTTDPLKAESWLKQIEKIFTVIGCTDDQRVVLASFMLQGEADHWWEATSRLMRAHLGNRPISWSMFQEAFNEKYFPDRVRFKMEADFLSLIQGNKSVAEYEEQFTALSRFVPKLIDEEGSKCRRFFEGLRPSIKAQLSILKLTTYSDIVDRAMIAERYLRESQTGRDTWNKNNKQYESRIGGSNQQGDELVRHSNNGSSHKNVPFCQYCGNSHIGECLKRKGACFGCGEVGHRIRDCPKKRGAIMGASSDETERKKLRTQGRVFALTKQDDEAPNKVVSGNLSLFNKEATVQFDPGATHSAIPPVLLVILISPLNHWTIIF